MKQTMKQTKRERLFHAKSDVVFSWYSTNRANIVNFCKDGVARAIMENGTVNTSIMWNWRYRNGFIEERTIGALKREDGEWDISGDSIQAAYKNYILHLCIGNGNESNI